MGSRLVLGACTGTVAHPTRLTGPALRKRLPRMSIKLSRLAIDLNARERQGCKFPNGIALGKRSHRGYRRLEGGRSIYLMETIMEGAPNRRSIIGVLSGAYRNVMESITRNRPAPNEA